jgi:predicted DsbA family dithiol-disulfide isomerase
MERRMQVEIWSDLVCPWCYLGKRRLEHALEQFAHRDRVDIVWRSFELEPDSPPEPQDLTSRLVSRYGMTDAEAAERNAHMTGLAAQAGLSFRLDIAKHGNTFAAHRVLHAARAAGLGSEAKERLLRGYFSEGRPISDPDTVVELVAEVGVDARAGLDDESLAREVRADEREAAELGITGVPFFVLGRRYAVSGAQPAELLLQALDQAWADTMEA